MLAQFIACANVSQGTIMRKYSIVFRITRFYPKIPRFEPCGWVWPWPYLAFLCFRYFVLKMVIIIMLISWSCKCYLMHIKFFVTVPSTHCPLNLNTVMTVITTGANLPYYFFRFFFSFFRSDWVFSATWSSKLFVLI